MKLRKRVLAAVLGAISIVSLSACNGGGGGINPFTPSRGTLRFINGSPDAGPVDVAIGGPNSTSPNWTGVPYAGGAQAAGVPNPGITSYIQFNAPTQSIFIYNNATHGQISVPQTSITITPNGRTTVVLTGSVTNKTARLVTFNEHLFQTVANSASVSFHHASVQFITTKFNVGDQKAGPNDSTSCASGFAIIPPPILFGPPIAFQEGLPQSVASTGIQFCAQSQADPTLILTLRPFDVDASNTGNVMPFTGGTSVNSDQNLSIYLIDGPASTGKPVLVGVFDPNH
ncbi:MAG: DUF4397 domain-containing protein [Candidatus Eremiobacteraeota bacterium]|nr:DUF4397 domain-containing protein [Candidatus Eremiobacteraeota bacterium]MBV9648046.1 DUF4397 domain-containing protein [Candidatus Eremiobacteraeota bacterium]